MSQPNLTEEEMDEIFSKACDLADKAIRAIDSELKILNPRDPKEFLLNQTVFYEIFSRGLIVGAFALGHSPRSKEGEEFIAGSFDDWKEGALGKWRQMGKEVDC